MKKKIILLTSCFIFLAALLAGCSGNDVTGVVLQDIHGKQYALNDYKGKWIVINYWASWCKPCYKEIPALNALAKQYKSQVLVFGVSYDRATGSKLAQIIKKMKVQFPTLAVDPAKVLGIPHVPGLPATYLINPKGKLSKRLLGMQSEKSLIAAMHLG